MNRGDSFMRSLTSALFFIVALALATAGPVLADKVVLVAGGGNGADGSPASGAKLQTPFGVDFDKSGNLFFVELVGQKVRRVDVKGIVTTIAGTGRKGDG